MHFTMHCLYFLLLPEFSAAGINQSTPQLPSTYCEILRDLGVKIKTPEWRGGG